jgi:hypothetical protein
VLVQMQLPSSHVEPEGHCSGIFGQHLLRQKKVEAISHLYCMFHSDLGQCSGRYMHYYSSFARPHIAELSRESAKMYCIVG